MLPKTFFVPLILCVIILLSPAEGWIMHAVYHNDAHPGKCFVNENLILSPGQVGRSPEGCAEIHCGNESGHAQVMGCSKFGDPENCRWDGPEDINAPFPLCCIEKFICNSSEDEVKAKNIQEHLREEFKRQVEERKNKI